MFRTKRASRLPHGNVAQRGSASSAVGFGYNPARTALADIVCLAGEDGGTAGGTDEEGVMAERKDLSDWLIHFVHNRDFNNDPSLWALELVDVPMAYALNGQAIRTSWYHHDRKYDMAADELPIGILQKIMHDGHIRAGWAYRNQKPTIYGPRAAVCFTEMPLYALLDYAKTRSDEYHVRTYGIALPKDDLFRAGARPVIYGLSSPHVEARPGDPYY